MKTNIHPTRSHRSELFGDRDTFGLRLVVNMVCSRGYRGM